MLSIQYSCSPIRLHRHPLVGPGGGSGGVLESASLPSPSLSSSALPSHHQCSWLSAASGLCPAESGRLGGGGRGGGRGEGGGGREGGRGGGRGGGGREGGRERGREGGRREGGREGEGEGGGRREGERERGREEGREGGRGREEAGKEGVKLSNGIHATIEVTGRYSGQ